MLINDNKMFQTVQNICHGIKKTLIKLKLDWMMKVSKSRTVINKNHKQFRIIVTLIQLTHVEILGFQLSPIDIQFNDH